MSNLELKSVSKVFGRSSKALDSLSMRVESGSFAVLVGPSGSGKSTALRLIAGLEQATEGSIHISGRDVSSLRPEHRNISMVFQESSLYYHMNVRQNMAFPLKVKKLPKSEIVSRVAEYADLVGVSQFLDRMPYELSGGQRQRVSFARALIKQPDICLFDEPLSNLDFQARVQFRDLVRKLHRRMGFTAVYVTHDQAEALTLADTLFVLADGRLQQAASPIDIYNQPANLFVAGFLGSPGINTIRGTVVRSDDGWMFENSTFRFQLDCDHLPGLADHADRAVIAAVRPEDVKLADQSAGSKREGIFHGSLVENAFHGDCRHLTVAAGDERLTFKADAFADISCGTNLGVQLDTERVMLFSADDHGRNLLA